MLPVWDRFANATQTIFLNMCPSFPCRSRARRAWDLRSYAGDQRSALRRPRRRLRLVSGLPIGRQDFVQRGRRDRPMTVEDPANQAGDVDETNPAFQEEPHSHLI